MTLQPGSGSGSICKVLGVYFNVYENQMGGATQSRTVQDGCCQMPSASAKYTKAGYVPWYDIDFFPCKGYSCQREYVPEDMLSTFFFFLITRSIFQLQPLAKLTSCTVVWKKKNGLLLRKYLVKFTVDEYSSVSLSIQHTHTRIITTSFSLLGSNSC